MMLVQQVRQGHQVSHVLKQILERGADGTCEYTRLSQVKLPTPTPCRTVPPKSVLRVFMPLPLPDMIAEASDRSALDDSCNAKNLSAARSAYRWASLLRSVLNHPYVGASALLLRPLYGRQDIQCTATCPGSRFRRCGQRCGQSYGHQGPHWCRTCLGEQDYERAD